MARVKSPLPAPKKCRYCNAEVSIVSNAAIYGREYGEWPWAYRCVECGAHVGMHPFTNIPLGTLADNKTSQARKLAKAAFNPLWQGGMMSRRAAYVWLAKQIGLPDSSVCHIGWMDAADCARVIDVCKSQIEARHALDSK